MISQHRTLKIRRFLAQLLEPWLLALSTRMSKPFCVALIVESLVLAGAIVWVFKADGSAWDSFMYYMLLALTVPLLALQLINRLMPDLSESIAFKYLAIFGVVMVWFSGMSGRAMVKDIFHVAPGEFSSALAAASFLAMSDWLAAAGMLACLLLELWAIFAAANSRYRYRKARYAQPWLRMVAIGLLFFVSFLTVTSLNKVMPAGVRQVIVARIAWDIDLLAAPKDCLPAGNQEPESNWRVFPRTVGESKTLLVRGLATLPEKPFWKYSAEEQELFATFDVHEVECGIDKAPVNNLEATQNKHALADQHRKATAYLWGISPIASTEIQH